jgi:hypothetical protein
MMGVMQNIASKVNYIEIVNYFIKEDSANSPSTLRKILGKDSKPEKTFTPKHYTTTALIQPLQRKSDLWFPKHVIAAIDSHVRDVSRENFSCLTDFLFKLTEICENDLHVIRYNYHFIN